MKIPNQHRHGFSVETIAGVSHQPCTNKNEVAEALMKRKESENIRLSFYFVRYNQNCAQVLLSMLTQPIVQLLHSK